MPNPQCNLAEFFAGAAEPTSEGYSWGEQLPHARGLHARGPGWGRVCGWGLEEGGLNLKSAHLSAGGYPRRPSFGDGWL